ncbi:MAG: hypothetical protein HN919_19210 [Verrucomicrobia bacterium]|jgi:cytochrome c biogenesis protein ResB|nr:hypothetical protein [Verrucomicrobiota bacterium]MBT7068434.1 hypothetical protein [Verrucomicrobiota bacterium]MBT7698998.1 hypothetical protein [Verrucomicrobiota bacterium]
MGSDSIVRPNRKRRLRKGVMWATLLLLLVFVVLSIVGAFLGAQRAAAFFGSTPVVLFWFALTILFGLGFLSVPNLWRKPGLLLSHAGCVLVLLGALWGSQTAHELNTRYLGSDRIHEGMLQIFEGEQSSTVISRDGQTILGSLPFAVALRDFRLEYYTREGSLVVAAPDGRATALDAVAGEGMAWGGERTALRILRVFRNFKITIGEGERTVTDDAAAGSNPALEIELTAADGAVTRRFVFPAGLMEHDVSYGGLKLTYEPAAVTGISDYKSDLVIMDGGREVKRKVIEVNKPLHYGGYDFYQSSYDSERGQYTVLSVVSDSGLWCVFGGYALLCLGIMWQCWLRHVIRYMRSKA